MSERRIPPWLPGAGVAVALVALVAWSFSQRYSVLTGSPFPVGVDGYFYPIQLRSLLETHHLQYAASPLSFWLMAPFAAATDPITGAKLGAAFYGALLALPAYAVGARLGGSRGAGLVTTALATCSAGSAYMSIEFVKNGIGITVAMTALWLVLRAVESPTRLRIACVVVGIVAALLAHKMAAAIVVVIAVPAVLVEAAGRGRLRGRRLFYVIGLAGAIVLSAVILGVVAPQRFLSPTDLQLLGGLWSSEPRWSLPALENSNSRLLLGGEPLRALILAVFAAVALILERDHAIARRVLPPLRALHRLVFGAAETTPTPAPARSVRVVSWIAVALGLVIGLPWLAVDDAQGLGMRLRIASFVPMALCAAVVLRVALRAVPSTLRAAVCVAIAIAATIFVPGSRTEGLIPMHPSLVSAAYSLTGKVPAGDTIVVPERHIVFMVAWYTRAKVSIRPDSVPIDERWRLLPLAWIEAGSDLDRALLAVRARSELPPVLGLHSRHPNGLVLVPEVTWQYVLSVLPPSARTYYASWPAI